MGFWARELQLARSVAWLERWRKVAARQHGAETSSKLRVPWRYTLHISMPTPNGPAVLDVTASPDVVKEHVETLFGFLDGTSQLPDGNWSYRPDEGWQRQ